MQVANLVDILGLFWPGILVGVFMAFLFGVFATVINFLYGIFSRG